VLQFTDINSNNYVTGEMKRVGTPIWRNKAQPLLVFDYW